MLFLWEYVAEEYGKRSENRFWKSTQIATIYLFIPIPYIFDALKDPNWLGLNWLTVGQVKSQDSYDAFAGNDTK